MKKLLLFISFLFLIGLVSAACPSGTIECPGSAGTVCAVSQAWCNNYKYHPESCKIVGTAVTCCPSEGWILCGDTCVKTDGFCKNLLNSPEVSCSLDKKSCCNTEGSVYDYTARKCCSTNYPYHHTREDGSGTCSNNRYSDSDNYFTRNSDCTKGETKCVGLIYYECIETSVKWIFKYQLKGEIPGKCGVACTNIDNCVCSSATECRVFNTRYITYDCLNKKCVGTENTVYFYRLENNTCKTINIKLSEKTINDYEILAECQNKIVSIVQPPVPQPSGFVKFLDSIISFFKSLFGVK